MPTLATRLNRHLGGWATLTWLCVQAACATAQPVNVKVAQRGDVVIVDVEATVAAAADTVWAVLTDYAHMAEFMSALKTSAVIGGEANALKVEQTGEARHGLLHFSFHTVRAVDTIPKREIRSHLIEGDFKSYELTTTLVDQGSTTLISQHGEYVPNQWVPPVVGPAAIKSETAKGYDEMIAEIMRRQRALSGSPSAPSSSSASSAPGATAGRVPAQ